MSIVNRYFSALIWYNFKDLLSSQFFRVSLGTSLAFVSLVFFVSQLSYSGIAAVALSFSWTLNAIFFPIVTIVFTCDRVSKDRQSGFYDFVTVKKIGYSRYLLGHFASFFIYLTLNWTIILFIEILCLLFLDVKISSILVFGFLNLALVLECVVLYFLTNWISMYLKPKLTFSLSLTLWLFGHGLDGIIKFMENSNSYLLKKMISIYQLVVPSFYLLELDVYLFDTFDSSQFIFDIFKIVFYFSFFIGLFFVFSRRKLRDFTRC